MFVAIPAFTMRNIRAPLPASSAWSCAAQRDEGLVLRTYPCEASGGAQVRMCTCAWLLLEYARRAALPTVGLGAGAPSYPHTARATHPPFPLASS